MTVQFKMVTPVFLVLILSVASIYGQTVTPYQYPATCAAPNTTNNAPGVLGPAPPLPVLPTTFQVRVEANIVDRGFTNVAEEYYDGQNNRAAIKTFQNNTVDYMILDYANDQIIYDVSNNCYATDMKYDDNNLLFGMKTPNGIPHVYTTNGALHFAKANGLTYMGSSSVIRGIKADHWQSCMYWGALQSNFTLDYYFSAYNWTTPDLDHQVPLRAEITGIQTVLGSYQFHHIYEYIDFRNQLWADDVDTLFETPKGTICTGRKQTRKVPVLSGQYSYREEIVTDGAVHQADVWYDLADKLVRFDYRPAFANSYPYYSTNPVTEVHDYSTGISYSIDKALGNCTILPIQNSTFDAKLNVSTTVSGKQFYIQMKGPSQLFYLDNTTYTYEGKRKVRGMLCDVFVSNRTDFSLPDYGPFNSIFEFYFLDQNWIENNNVGIKSQANTDIPVQLAISTPDWVGYKATYNIYDWDAEDPSYKVFDIRSCFPQSSQKSMILELPGTYDVGLLTPYKPALLANTKSQILSITHMANIRIQNAEFHISPTNAYFVATLLNLPPPSSYFKKLAGVYATNGNGKQLTGRGITVDMCATACNNGTSCNAFDFCPTSGMCTMYLSRADQLAPSSTCSHYSRAAAAMPFELPLDISWRDLKNEVLAGHFKISAQINGQTQSYIASTIDDNVIQNANQNLQTQSLMLQFNHQINKGLNGYDDYDQTGVSVDECANLCINKNSWVCNSFTFCYDTGYCKMSKLHPDSRPSAVQNELLCDLYTRKYTAGYTQVPGKTVLSSSNSIYQNIFSADECAKLCTFYNGFNCKSFDYCDDISTCYLGSTHYFDVPKSDIQDSPMCNHYSRKYLADFQKSSRKKLKNSADRIISNIPVDQCAKLCVQEESFSCASFGYCGNLTECRLSTASMANVGQVTYESNMYCDIYNRQTFPDGTAYINNPAKYYNIKTGNNGYSAGAMAGLAFGMLIMGAVLAVAGYFIFNKVRGSNPNDGMAVSFVKESDS